MFIKQILLPILLIACLPLILKLLIRLRLGFALLYIVMANTVFYKWMSENSELSNRILAIIIAVTALSWGITLFRKLLARHERIKFERGQEAFVVAQLRKARSDGHTNEDISFVSENGMPLLQIK